MQISTVVYYQVVDARAAEYEVADFNLALEQITQTTLRNVIGNLTLDKTLTSRDEINAKLRTVLDEVTEKWGIRVTRVEIKEIIPPRDIQQDRKSTRLNSSHANISSAAFCLKKK